MGKEKGDREYEEQAGEGGDENLLRVEIFIIVGRPYGVYNESGKRV